MKKMIVALTGKKGSGKNTVATQLAAAYLNYLHAGANNHVVNCEKPWHVTPAGLWFDGDKDSADDKAYNISSGSPDLQCDTVERFVSPYVNVISFADPLKEFCMNVLGLRREACYGTDADKNCLTSLEWEGLPLGVRWKYRTSWLHPRSGYMTGREVMQIFGTDLIRRWYQPAWASAAIKKALACPQRLVLFTDCRFPDELKVVKDTWDIDRGIYRFSVRLTRLWRESTDRHPSETALDHLSAMDFDNVVPATLSFEDQGAYAAEMLARWLRSSGELR